MADASGQAEGKQLFLFIAVLIQFSDHWSKLFVLWPLCCSWSEAPSSAKFTAKHILPGKNTTKNKKIFSGLDIKFYLKFYFNIRLLAKIYIRFNEVQHTIVIQLSPETFAPRSVYLILIKPSLGAILYTQKYDRMFFESDQRAMSVQWKLSIPRKQQRHTRRGRESHIRWYICIVISLYKWTMAYDCSTHA